MAAPSQKRARPMPPLNEKSSHTQSMGPAVATGAAGVELSLSGLSARSSAASCAFKAVS